MSEATEQALLRIFEEKMHEINQANRILRRWMYSLISICGIALLSGMYWAGAISEKVDSINSNVEKITMQADRMESKYTDIVWFLVDEAGYRPDATPIKK